MDIASLSTALSMTQTSNDFGVVMLSKQLDSMETMGDSSPGREYRHFHLMPKRASEAKRRSGCVQKAAGGKPAAFLCPFQTASGGADPRLANDPYSRASRLHSLTARKTRGSASV